MGFKAKVEPEATQQAAGILVASSQLTDVAESSTALALCTLLGQERASIDNSIKDRLDAKFLDVKGRDLDAACAQLPNGGVQRAGAAAASGACLVLTRSGSTAAVLGVPAGTTFGRTDNPTIRYVLTTYQEFGVGESTIGGPTGYIPVVCTTLGTAGNCGATTINTVVSGPDGLTSVEQAVAIGGGVVRETDAQLRNRAKAYLAAFMGSNTRRALEFVALSFQSAAGIRARNAATYFDPINYPGYVELVVDDGTQFAGQTTTGQTVVGTFSNNQRRVYLEGPDVPDNLTTSQVTINGGTPSSVRWSLVPEGGELWFDQGYLSEGDTYEIGGYTLYIGFVAELQAVVNGTSTDPITGLGWGAAGCRVRVVPPVPNLVNFSVAIALEDGYSIETVSDQVRQVLTEYCASLGPGVPFLIMDAFTAINQGVPGARNVTFYPENDAQTLVCVDGDVYPTSQRASIRLNTFEVR